MLQTGPSCSTEEAVPAIIDKVATSRYRFYAAADSPGRACGPANISKFVPDIPASPAGGCSAASAALVGLPIFLSLFHCHAQQCPEASVRTALKICDGALYPLRNGEYLSTSLLSD